MQEEVFDSRIMKKEDEEAAEAPVEDVQCDGSIGEIGRAHV